MKEELFFSDDFLGRRTKNKENFAVRMIKLIVPESGLSELLLQIEKNVRKRVEQLLKWKKTITYDKDDLLDTL